MGKSKLRWPGIEFLSVELDLYFLLRQNDDDGRRSGNSEADCQRNTDEIFHGIPKKFGASKKMPPSHEGGGYCSSHTR